MDLKDVQSEGMIAGYDCHCHIFNITNVGLSAVMRQLDDVILLLSLEKEKKAGSSAESRKNRIKIKENLQKADELIKFFTSGSDKIFDMLDRHYDRKFILFPMMFDADYVFDSANDEELFRIKSLLSSINKKFRIRKNGFQTQYQQIRKIADDPEFSPRMRPFLGVDPRRPGIKYYLNKTGLGKLFAGIKVYPPNGFSPYDKVLTGEGSVFEFCEKNGIPVVTHSSSGGFATPAHSLDINGMIMPAGGKTPEYFDGRYDFSLSLKDGYLNMVRERAHVLNHPLIWNEVLKRYPNLILVMAHFGSGSDEWQENILQMMKRYRNLYTDVSCMYDSAKILKVKKICISNPDIADKVLYGSDYFIDLFMAKSFETYLETMRRTLGRKYFLKFSVENPQKFMERWYKYQ